MASTYTPIATTTASGSTSTVSFTSISGSYTDLVLVASVRSTAANTVDILNVRLNNDSSTLYSYTRLTGDGSSAASARETGLTAWRIGYNIPAANAASGTYGLDIFQLQNYSNTTTYKTALWRNSAAGIEAAASACLYRSTSAITQIELGFGVGNLAAGSTFTLYGIKAA
jgi:hypothetical protein